MTKKRSGETTRSKQQMIAVELLADDPADDNNGGMCDNKVFHTQLVDEDDDGHCGSDDPEEDGSGTEDEDDEDNDDAEEDESIDEVFVEHSIERDVEVFPRDDGKETDDQNLHAADVHDEEVIQIKI